ncbi:MAG: fumarate hydratase class II [Bacteroidia bacterium]|jgi:fumarate hydratase class II
MTERMETDSMGDIEVPAEALYGAQTQRAINNFNFSGRRLPTKFICHLAMIKAACVRANASLGVMPAATADGIFAAAMAVAAGQHSDQFPVDVFQTGSGTSTNMNMNEVIARLVQDSAVGKNGLRVHPNDDVNRSQSSNDVIPTCLQVSASLAIERELMPALQVLIEVFDSRAPEFATIIKTGRTHLMDAMPLSLQQELATWQFQLLECQQRFAQMLVRLKALPLGGTAVGTGVNSPAGFSRAAISALNQLEDSDFTPVAVRGSRMAAQDTSLECSATLKALAVVMLKMTTDLRWMASGPLAGLAEIQLKALQPGSSIMPGKVNPVVPEAVAMIAAEVLGNDTTITVAAQSGNFQLNVMLPLIADKLLGSITLLTSACGGLQATLRDMTINRDGITSVLYQNPMLVTGLNEVIGYAAAAEIAKQAGKQNRSVLDVALELTDLSRDELERYLDPLMLADPHDEGLS